ncbi:hypothetical protein DWX64_14395 [Clostridium sp. AF20-17LB]|nr:hypothetical protein [Clostridium sp. AF20-17LB]RHR00730.1 hypothetical protein DWX64_14395 [Clostridium sp. AF20-17LB]
MLYVRIANEDGTISFHLLRENNIYVHCETCGSMVSVDDPINFIANMGIIMDDAFNRCAKCSEEHFAWEEEYCESLTSEL